MALEAHLAELSEKHRRIEDALHEERQHPSTDALKLTELKKQKLRLKEEIERLRTAEGQV